IIDAVSEVVYIDSTQLQETPDFGKGIETNFITSIAKINERVVMLLDIEKILSNEEMQALSEIK
ncbi:MAG: chemotaxis protein CheW, partial [Fibrobacterales bacterium]